MWQVGMTEMTVESCVVYSLDEKQQPYQSLKDLMPATYMSFQMLV